MPCNQNCEQGRKCTYSRTMNQQYPRKCIHCGKTEQPAQGSEQAPCEQPVAERFLMKDKGKSYWAYSDYDNSKDWQPLYTRPAPPCQECKNLKHDLEGYMEANKALINREWVNLTDDEVKKILSKISDDMYPWKEGMLGHLIARAIEQALKEKNT